MFLGPTLIVNKLSLSLDIHSLPIFHPASRTSLFSLEEPSPNLERINPSLTFHLLLQTIWLFLDFLSNMTHHLFWVFPILCSTFQHDQLLMLPLESTPSKTLDRNIWFSSNILYIEHIFIYSAKLSLDALLYVVILILTTFFLRLKLLGVSYGACVAFPFTVSLSSTLPRRHGGPDRMATVNGRKARACTGRPVRARIPLAPTLSPLTPRNFTWPSP